MLKFMKCFVFFIKELATRYFKDEVGDSAAAMTYYLIFSFFPIVIMGSTILGYANISPDVVYEIFKDILPNDIIEIVNEYLIYVTLYKSKNILMVSIFFTVYFPMRAMYKTVNEINNVYGQENKRNIFVKFIIVLAFTLFFVVISFVSSVMFVLGRGMLSAASEYFEISDRFINFWVAARFFMITMILFVTMTLLYWGAPERKVRLSEAVPGAAAAVLGFITASSLFSYYVENLGNYSVVFGSIGAVIVLILWIYIISTIIIIGAEINCVLKNMLFLCDFGRKN